jgi:hypothetical protein
MPPVHGFWMIIRVDPELSSDISETICAVMPPRFGYYLLLYYDISETVLLCPNVS